MIGKEVYCSDSIDYVINFANEDFKDSVGKIDSINKYVFKTEKFSGAFIILKKEPKYKYVPYEFSEETWKEIKNREVCMNQAQGKCYFTVTELRQIGNRAIINGYEASIVGLSARFLDTGEPVAKKVLIEEC